MAIGYLKLQARTAHDALPLAGVRVKVLDDRGDVAYDLTTDENGETAYLPLETLDKSFSQNQYFTGIPYKSYHVLAQAAGFNSLHVSDIPIYDGETAVLPLTLVPMQDRQRRPVQAEISVGKPAVALPGTRDQEGPGPDISPNVLRQVVIPNPITVHLGTPGSSAADVQVSFPDYVKNVASSEIYPTWPEAALTANIYAIITFALNRIYTEWSHYLSPSTVPDPVLKPFPIPYNPPAKHFRMEREGIHRLPPAKRQMTMSSARHNPHIQFHFPIPSSVPKRGLLPFCRAFW